MKILVVNGPNLNRLGQRNPAIYGVKTLAELEDDLKNHAAANNATILSFQSNSEGELIDFLQKEGPQANGLIINPAALTHYGYSLRECIDDIGLPTIEVHISDIHAREEWRRVSVISPVCVAQISGHGLQGYMKAMDHLMDQFRGEKRL